MVAVSLKKLFFQAEDGIRDIRVGDWSSDVCSSDLIGMEQLKLKKKLKRKLRQQFVAYLLITELKKELVS